MINAVLLLLYRHSSESATSWNDNWMCLKWFVTHNYSYIELEVVWHNATCYMTIFETELQTCFVRWGTLAWQAMYYLHQRYRDMVVILFGTSCTSILQVAQNKFNFGDNLLHLWIAIHGTWVGVPNRFSVVADGAVTWEKSSRCHVENTFGGCSI